VRFEKVVVRFVRSTVSDMLSRRDVVLAGHLGPEHNSLPDIVATLASPDAQTRAAAYGALARLDELSEKHLLDALGDPSPKVLHRAITLAAGRDRNDPAIDARLAAITEGDDDDLAEVAVWALGERWQEQAASAGADAILDAIENLVAKHADALVREAAVASLGAIGAQRSIPVIIAAAQDKATVRRRAVIALAPFDGPDVVAALTAAREDRDWQVRQAAEDLLAD
jgi:HEAT repeat protein